LDPISDEELMTRVGQDDLDSLVPLFERYQRKLHNFFLRLSDDSMASEDLVQNLFMRIIRYRKSFDPSRHFKTWAYQMARNLYYDHYHKEVKNRSDFIKLDELEPYAEPINTMENPQVDEERLGRAMHRLPVEKRELLIMSKLQGMPYEEIAVITNTTVGNVKVRVHRAIEALRNIYFQHHQL
jgi:RNA polymerase sigma-70 factor, ECF subfamily